MNSGSSHFRQKTFVLFQYRRRSYRCQDSYRIACLRTLCALTVHNIALHCHEKEGRNDSMKKEKLNDQCHMRLHLRDGFSKRVSFSSVFHISLAFCRVFQSKLEGFSVKYIRFTTALLA
jgi:hypothetical protein